jgi:uncharacterized BrkB/YihY/UPF0761 family membrane protein
MSVTKSFKRNHYYRHTSFFIRKLFDDELTYYASSLSFYTVSTIIPIFFIVLLSSLLVLSWNSLMSTMLPLKHF